MDKATRDKLILIVLGLALVWVVNTWGVRPLDLPPLDKLREEVGKLRTEKQTLEASVRNAEAQVAGLDKIRKERAALEAQLKELSEQLPSERETPKLLRSVETLAGKSGLSIAQVKRLPVRVQELYAEIPTEVVVTGTFPEVLKFAGELAALDRLVTVHEAEVARPPAPLLARRLSAPPVSSGPVASAGRIGAAVTAMVYQTLPEPAAPGSGAPAGK